VPISGFFIGLILNKVDLRPGGKLERCGVAILKRRPLPSIKARFLY
jgi:hypothetical protein